MGYHFVVSEPVLRPREVGVDETLATPAFIADWAEVLERAVREENPWAILGMRPDGEEWLFEATDEGCRRAAEWPSGSARLLFRL